MKIEYETSRDHKKVTRMLVIFETPDEWYSLVYDDSWIAKAVRANTGLRGQGWGEHVRSVMPVIVKDLSEDELVIFERIKAILNPS